MKTFTGECKFCKQINAFEWTGDSIPTKEQLAEEGTRACSCEAAECYRDREYKINAAIECLDRILPNADEESAKVLLQNATPYIARGAFSQISINIGNGTTVKMKLANDSIKVNRTDTSSRQETV